MNTANNERLAALGMLSSGRGIPICCEALPHIAMRWERTINALEEIKYDFKQSGKITNSSAKHAIEAFASAAAAVQDLITTGVRNPSPTPRFGVVYRTTSDWFEKVCQSLINNPPSENKLIECLEAVRQQGIDKIYELDQTAVLIPELDHSGMSMFPNNFTTARGRYDTDHSIKLLKELIGNNRYAEQNNSQQWTSSKTTNLTWEM